LSILSKLLVKILIGLVTVISVLGLFSFTVVKLSNEVRFEHYWVAQISPALSYLAKHAKHEKLRIDELEGVRLIKKQDKVLSELYKARLEFGQVVLEVGSEALFAWSAFDTEHLIAFESEINGEAIYRVYLNLIQQVLNVSSEKELNSKVNELEKYLDVQVMSVSSDDAELAGYKSMSMKFSESGIYFLSLKDRVKGSVRLDNNQRFIVLFQPYYSPFSWPIIFFLLIIIVGALTLISYLLIQHLERRLRNIETAAGRISRGELDARVSNASDEDSISRLGAAFNSMADHIQRLMLVQKEMIHAVSHELRTPVARIRFGVQMIEDCPSQQELEKQVRGIDGDIQELDELIDEILTYARLEQGGPILAFQEADVSAIVEQVVSEQSSVKPEMTIFSEYKKSSDLWKISEVEARYIHRSIQNLVGNATRYADSKVKVVCVFDSETCRIDVEDNGPGIPESDWESVFTPFARLDDSRTRSSGGYGLGLSIVRRILYWHGGQAFLGRSEMGGAKFSLVWPRKQAKH
jgi:two-component system sensor histidine kinase RstB